MRLIDLGSMSEKSAQPFFDNGIIPFGVKASDGFSFLIEYVKDLQEPPPRIFDLSMRSAVRYLAASIAPAAVNYNAKKFSGPPQATMLARHALEGFYHEYCVLVHIAATHDRRFDSSGKLTHDLTKGANGTLAGQTLSYFVGVSSAAGAHLVSDHIKHYLTLARDLVDFPATQRLVLSADIENILSAAKKIQHPALYACGYAVAGAVKKLPANMSPLEFKAAAVPMHDGFITVHASGENLIYGHNVYDRYVGVDSVFGDILVGLQLPLPTRNRDAMNLLHSLDRLLHGYMDEIGGTPNEFPALAKDRQYLHNSIMTHFARGTPLFAKYGAQLPRRAQEIVGFGNFRVFEELTTPPDGLDAALAALAPTGETPRPKLPGRPAPFIDPTTRTLMTVEASAINALCAGDTPVYGFTPAGRQAASAIIDNLCNGGDAWDAPPRPGTFKRTSNVLGAPGKFRHSFEL